MKLSVHLTSCYTPRATYTSPYPQPPFRRFPRRSPCRTCPPGHPPTTPRPTAECPSPLGGEAQPSPPPLTPLTPQPSTAPKPTKPTTQERTAPHPRAPLAEGRAAPPPSPSRKAFAAAAAAPPPAGGWTVVQNKRAAKVQKKRAIPPPTMDQGCFELIHSECSKLNRPEAENIISLVNRALHREGVSNVRIDRPRCSDMGRLLGVTTPASTLQDLPEHRDTVLWAGRVRDSGISDIVPQRKWKWVRIHSVPLNRYMGRVGGGGLPKLWEELEAENIGLQIPAEVRWPGGAKVRARLQRERSGSSSVVAAVLGEVGAEGRTEPSPEETEEQGARGGLVGHFVTFACVLFWFLCVALFFGGSGEKEIGEPCHNRSFRFGAGHGLKAEKWRCCPRGQRQAAAIALRAACSGIARELITHTSPYTPEGSSVLTRQDH